MQPRTHPGSSSVEEHVLGEVGAVRGDGLGRNPGSESAMAIIGGVFVEAPCRRGRNERGGFDYRVYVCIDGVDNEIWLTVVTAREAFATVVEGGTKIGDVVAEVSE